MFKDDYNSEIEKIRPDGYIKQKVLNKISSQNTAKKNKVVYYRVAAAIAACAAIAMSVWAINLDRRPKIDLPEIKDVSYDSVYDAVKSLLPSENIFNYYTEDDAVEIENEAANVSGTKGSGQDKNAATNSSNANASTKPSTSKDDQGTNDFSQTNTQVDGVDESDIVKTDGEYIYSLSMQEREVRIIKAGRTPQKISEIELMTGNIKLYTTDMYLKGNNLVVLCYNSNRVFAVIYDVTDKSVPKKLYECSQSGWYRDSRLIGDKLYLISDYTISNSKIKREQPLTYMPEVTAVGTGGPVHPDTVAINKVCNRPEYTVICSYDITSGKLVGTQSLLGGLSTLYCSTDNIIIAGFGKDGKTDLTRYSISDGKISLAAEGEIEGSLLNQFSIDEYKGNFRFVTTLNKGIETEKNGIVSYTVEQSNSLVILNSQLNQIGLIENLAPDERVYSVRFMGDIAYFVTFRQVDPLFSADLSDPHNPKIIGALKIPGFSNYLFPYGDGKLLGIGQDADEKSGAVTALKLSMFDISNPANVTESAKTVLTDTKYSQALSDHKSSLVNPKRNLIGFQVYARTGNYYRLFSFENGGFVQKLSVKLSVYDEFTRGIFIGEEFYIVADKELLVYDLNSFEQIGKLTF